MRGAVRVFSKVLYYETQYGHWQ